jgi:flavin reductase (DIM6/NTAB) family NADH-FMN oxidoreductase RutF
MDTVHSPLGEALTTFDFEKLDVKTIYSLMIGAIVPRPIALIATRGRDGTGNLAPFSYFTAVSSAPPCIAVSITPKSATEAKDTLRNISETREFSINLVAEWMIEQVHQTSAAYPYGVDEMEKVGLTPLPSETIRPPRVKESPVQLECILEQLVPVGEGRGSSTLVIGRIQRLHVASSALIPQSSEIRTDLVRPIARLGGNDYGRIGGIFSIARPQV